MRWRLQPYTVEAAAQCGGGCGPMRRGLTSVDADSTKSRCGLSLSLALAKGGAAGVRRAAASSDRDAASSHGVAGSSHRVAGSVALVVAASLA